MQSRVRTVSRAETMRALQKILLEDGAEHPRHRLLDQPIFDRTDANRSALAVSLRDIHPPDHRRSVATGFQTCVEVPQVAWQVRRVVLVPLSINAWCRLLAHRTERQTQKLLIHELDDVSEACLPSCSLT